MQRASYINRPVRLVLVLILVIAASSPVASPLSDEDAAAVVHRFLKCWQTGDSETFASLLHEDVMFAYPGGRLGKAGLMSLFRKYRGEKKDIKVYFWDIFLLQDNRFATAYQFAATDRETGLRQAVGTGVAGEFKNGKILVFKEYYDESVATMQYQGKLPLDEGEVSPWPASIWLRPHTID